MLCLLFEDIHGNTSSDSFQITISDAEAPEFTFVPASLSVSNDAGDCGAVVEWNTPEAQDNCGVSGITLSHQSGDQFPVGDTTVNLTVTDIHGNSTEDSFVVTVTDDENPVITSIPDSINLTNETEQRSLSSALILHMPSELIKVLVNVLRLADDAAVNIAKFVGNSNEYGRIARLGDEFRRKR